MKTRWPQENFQALIHIALRCSLARHRFIDSRDLDAAIYVLSFRNLKKILPSF